MFRVQLRLKGVTSSHKKAYLKLTVLVNNQAVEEKLQLKVIFNSEFKASLGQTAPLQKSKPIC